MISARHVTDVWSLLLACLLALDNKEAESRYHSKLCNHTGPLLWPHLLFKGFMKQGKAFLLNKFSPSSHLASIDPSTHCQTLLTRLTSAAHNF